MFISCIYLHPNRFLGKFSIYCLQILINFEEPFVWLDILSYHATISDCDIQKDAELHESFRLLLFSYSLLHLSLLFLDLNIRFVSQSKLSNRTLIFTLILKYLLLMKFVSFS